MKLTKVVPNRYQRRLNEPRASTTSTGSLTFNKAAQENNKALFATGYVYVAIDEESSDQKIYLSSADSKEEAYRVNISGGQGGSGRTVSIGCANLLVKAKFFSPTTKYSFTIAPCDVDGMKWYALTLVEETAYRKQEHYEDNRNAIEKLRGAQQNYRAAMNKKEEDEL
jgi:hypothetical protein